MVDAERLRLALKVTEDAADRGVHQQDAWIRTFDCGTGGCFAGNWALHNGCEPVWENSHHTDEAFQVVTPEGARVHVSDWVRDDLGLERRQANALFDAWNGLPELRDLVETIITDAV